MGRYLLPGLTARRARGQLPERFEVLSAARQDWDDEHFRGWAADWLQREAGGVDAAATAALVRASRYERLDLGDAASVAACIAGEGPVAVYLALPPAVFSLAVTALHRAEIPADSQVVLEKSATCFASITSSRRPPCRTCSEHDWPNCAFRRSAAHPDVGFYGAPVDAR